MLRSLLLNIHHSAFIIHHFLLQSRPLEDLAHCVGAPGLRQEELDEACADLAHQLADAGVAREHHAEGMRVCSRDLAKEGRAAYLRHDLVADDHVEGALDERATRLCESRSRAHFVVVLERRAEHLKARRLVVEVEYRKPLHLAHVLSPPCGVSAAAPADSSANAVPPDRRGPRARITANTWHGRCKRSVRAE